MLNHGAWGIWKATSVGLQPGCLMHFGEYVSIPESCVWSQESMATGQEAARWQPDAQPGALILWQGQGHTLNQDSRSLSAQGMFFLTWFWNGRGITWFWNVFNKFLWSEVFSSSSLNLCQRAVSLEYKKIITLAALCSGKIHQALCFPYSILPHLYSPVSLLRSSHDLHFHCIHWAGMGRAPRGSGHRLSAGGQRWRKWGSCPQRIPEM